MRTGQESDARVMRPIVHKLRSLCLSLPETTERSSWGHPNFRAGKRTFASFEIIGGRPSIAFRLPAVDVERLARRKRFFPTPYGRGLWVSLWADRSLDWRFVAQLLDRSYRTVALRRMLNALDHTGERRSNRTETRGLGRTDWEDE